MTVTISPTTLYILCYYIAGEAGGLIDDKVYSDPGDASFALATHRRNHHEGFATDEELQAAADEAVEREWQSYVDHLEVNPHDRTKETPTPGARSGSGSTAG